MSAIVQEQDRALKGEITQEVVETLVDLMKDIIGEKAVNIVLRQFPREAQLPGRDLVFRFAEETEKLLGTKGAYAILRQMGRELAKSLAAKLPEDQWPRALEVSLNKFGFAERIEKASDHANICSCVFYPILEERNLPPVGHAVCWAGWGFIEGFVKLMDGTRGIQWVERDLERKACKFEFLK